jgi:hypothetical protein
MSIYQRLRRGLFGIATAEEIAAKSPPLTFLDDLALLAGIAALALIFVAYRLAGGEAWQ